MMVFIKTHDDTDLIEIVVDNEHYDAVYDEATGDWLAISDDDEMQKWLKTRDGAIQYILEHTGVIEEGSYEQAPDRTSA